MKTNREWNVVFIDDEVDIREVVSITFAGAGYQIWYAEYGEAGIRLNCYLTPRIVIADVRIPEMDGIRVLRFDVSDIITKLFNCAALHGAMARAKSHFITHELNPELHLPAGS